MISQIIQVPSLNIYKTLTTIKYIVFCVTDMYLTDDNKRNYNNQSIIYSA